MNVSKRTLVTLCVLGVLGSALMSFAWMFSCWDDSVRDAAGMHVRDQTDADRASLILWAIARTFVSAWTAVAVSAALRGTK